MMWPSATGVPTPPAATPAVTHTLRTTPNLSRTPSSETNTVEAGACVDQAAKDGRTPIFTAAQEDHLEVVRALVEAAADPSICMAGNGWSPLIVAAWSGHAEVVAELLQHGADRSIATAQEHLEIPAGSTALSVAQLKGHQGVVDLLR